MFLPNSSHKAREREKESTTSVKHFVQFYRHFVSFQPLIPHCGADCFPLWRSRFSDYEVYWSVSVGSHRIRVVLHQVKSGIKTKEACILNNKKIGGKSGTDKPIQQSNNTALKTCYLGASCFSLITTPSLPNISMGTSLRSAS